MTREDCTTTWTSTWPDALAFVAGLGAAWLGGWTAAELVWTLWLSSLVVGYAMIVWRILRPVILVARGAWRDRADVRLALAAHGSMPAVAIGSIALVGALFSLAFFTIHFGFFHFVHSQFLATLFPLGNEPARGMAGLETYLEVGRRFWSFLPAAFLAERAAFALKEDVQPRDVSVTAEAIAARKAAAGNEFGGMMAPYRNVMRMHLLIIVFGFASVSTFARLDTFAVYALVYAVYFFPWRMVRAKWSPALNDRLPGVR